MSNPLYIIYRQRRQRGPVVMEWAAGSFTATTLTVLLSQLSAAGYVDGPYTIYQNGRSTSGASWQRIITA